MSIELSVWHLHDQFLTDVSRGSHFFGFVCYGSTIGCVDLLLLFRSMELHNCNLLGQGGNGLAAPDVAVPTLAATGTVQTLEPVARGVTVTDGVH